MLYLGKLRGADMKKSDYQKIKSEEIKADSLTVDEIIGILKETPVITPNPDNRDYRSGDFDIPTPSGQNGGSGSSYDYGDTGDSRYGDIPADQYFDAKLIIEQIMQSGKKSGVVTSENASKNEEVSKDVPASAIQSSKSDNREFVR